MNRNEFIHARPLLLSLGYNADLLRLRSQVLATRYNVVTVGDLKALEVLSNSSAFRVLLLCHSVPEEEQRQAVDDARLRWPDIKAISITKVSSDKDSPAVDRVVGSLEGPLPLLRAVQDLLSGVTSVA